MAKRSMPVKSGWRLLCIAGGHILLVKKDGAIAKLPVGLAEALKSGEPVDCEIHQDDDGDGETVFSHRGEEVARIPRELVPILGELLPDMSAAVPVKMDPLAMEMLHLCRKTASPEKLIGKYSKSTVNRRRKELERSRLLQCIKRGLYRTTDGGLQVLKNRDQLPSGEDNEKGGEAVDNPYSLGTTEWRLRELRQICDRYHIGPREVSWVVEACMELGERGLEGEDLKSMLDVSSETGESPAQIISAFKSKAQMESVVKELEKHREQIADLDAKIDRKRSVLEHLGLDPYELRQLSDLKKDLDKAHAWPDYVGTFLETADGLRKSLGGDASMLGVQVIRLGGFIGRLSKEKLCDPDEAVAELDEILQAGYRCEAVRRMVEEQERRLQALRSELAELQAQVGPLESRRDALAEAGDERRSRSSDDTAETAAPQDSDVAECRGPASGARGEGQDGTPE